MFTMDDVKKTRLFQEIEQKVAQEIGAKERQKGKLETVTRLLKLGLTVEKIAEVLELDIEMVRKAANQENGS
jgi:predicted transposase YdaD